MNRLLDQEFSVFVLRLRSFMVEYDNNLYKMEI